MKKIIFIFFLLLTSCGYQSIYSSSNVEGFTFKVIEIRGDDEVNNRIIYCGDKASPLYWDKHWGSKKINKN